MGPIVQKEKSLLLVGNVNRRLSLVIPIPETVLVVCLRRLGDVLLATPLLRSLRRSWPNATIDVLVYAETTAMLQGNPDIDHIIALPKRGGEWVRYLLPRFRAYDLALALQTSDRAHFVARWCGRRAGGLIPPPGEPGRAWKRVSERITATPRDEQHTVVRYLGLADALGLPREAKVVPPDQSGIALPATLTALMSDPGGYAVIHPMPMYPYKAWTSAGWREVISELQQRGLRVVVTGGPAESERAAVRALLAGLPADSVLDVCGQFEFATLAVLLKGARIYVGTDTSVTHLAAACNITTVALFGPSDPVTWGPWPARGVAAPESPWRRTAPLQRSGNVIVTQGTQARSPGCIPCRKDGCENRLDSHSDCLDWLHPATVIAAIDTGLRAS